MPTSKGDSRVDTSTTKAAVEAPTDNMDTQQPVVNVGKRYTVLTDKAREQLEERKIHIEQKLDQVWTETQLVALDLDLTSDSTDAIQGALRTFKRKRAEYGLITDEMFMLLIRANTEDSLGLYDTLKELHMSRDQTMRTQVEDAVVRIASLSDKSSTHTHQSEQGAAATHQAFSADGFVQFLARKDLVIQGLTEFDNKAENFRAWRLSFRNTIESAKLSPLEEMDLLVRWTSGRSCDIVKRMRAVNILNPTAGLKGAWSRLEETFGRPEIVTDSLLKMVKDFPKIGNQEYQKLREFSDILDMVNSAKEEGDLPGLLYLDTYIGVSDIVQKLPYNLQEKWRARGKDYKERNNVSFPPFSFFTTYVRKMADERTDPSFDFGRSVTNTTSISKERPRSRLTSSDVTVRKTEVENGSRHIPERSAYSDVSGKCPIHKTSHPLHTCREFKAMTWEQRIDFLKSNGICFRCCATKEHMSRDCRATIKCSECGSTRHMSTMHINRERSSTSQNGGERHVNANRNVHVGNEGENARNASGDTVSSTCTEVCGEFHGKSCAKICLVKVYPSDQSEKAVKVYALLDDQSNKSLAKTELFEMFGLGEQDVPYSLKTCAGSMQVSGRRGNGLTVESLDGKTILSLPTLIECNEIPDNRSEIPTPEVGQHFAHIRPISSCIPDIDVGADILLLLGRDILQVHKVREQRNGPGDTPFAQRLDLGWVIVGDVCLNGTHRRDDVSTCKTFVHPTGRTSLLEPCLNKMVIKDNDTTVSEGTRRYSELSRANNLKREMFIKDKFEDGIGTTIFERTKSDNKVGLSVEDRKFLDIMNKDMFKDETGNWVAPLPFKSPRPPLPNSREVAKRRLRSLQHTLARKPKMAEHYLRFMGDLIQNGHAEVAPPLSENEECWFLPHFGVYHPHKPEKIRVVFDSSSQVGKVSLNNVLLSGPDLMNSLLGVLLRFRHEPVAFMADIQQMFHSFYVRPDHRNYLRFLWHKDNKLDGEVVDYRMKVHLFGNSPSPAVANYGLQKAAETGEEKYGSDAREFVRRNFYVDDGLKSTSTLAEAIDLLRRTQEMLADSNLRLHKIVSNSVDVMNAFPQNDHAGDLQNLDLSCDTPPMQRSLGVCWDIKSDTFAFNVSAADKPYTRRGVLSVTNSLYDPLGLVAPVTLEGKHFLRSVMAEKGSNVEWDQPLPPDKQKHWQRWTESLSSLSALRVPRTYAQCELGSVVRKELHVFADASDIAIAACVYLRLVDGEGKCNVSFVLGKSKLAPAHATTTPRLELCAAVLAVELLELVEDELGVAIDSVTLYSDSKVALGYITNETRRFYVYVTNRVERIRSMTNPDQWCYISTEINPADHATRPVAAADLDKTTWLFGPKFLLENRRLPVWVTERLPEQKDPEVKPDLVSTLHTKVVTNSLLSSDRFDRFSRWDKVLRSIASLIRVARNFVNKTNLEVGRGKTPLSVEEMDQAHVVVIKSVQRTHFQQEIDCLAEGSPLPRNSPVRSLHPYVDEKGLFRVGGRLDRSDLPSAERHPIIIPGKCHVATLIIRHYHERVRHQGRLFTHGSVRAAGLWIVGERRLINDIIRTCVKCRKLRGASETQLMADLPIERLTPEPPFTNVGLDVFGPWGVTARKTRGGHANAKRWAILFTCMAVRAVHIEVIEEMTASCTINAIRRFFAIRGTAKQMKSDNGTNFVGACNELNQLLAPEGTEAVGEFLIGEGCTWTFNPPHSSHMGGVWERMIGVVRRVLDSMFRDLGPAQLTHDVLVTFMAEVSAIVNARPLVPISSDPEAPELLTPQSLLTQKVGVSMTPPPGEFTGKDLFGKQWRRVQYLADVFWSRWRREYLPLLQGRRKWQDLRDDIRPGDLVLVKDKSVQRNDWPTGRVVSVFPSDDGKVRKVEVRLVKNDTTKTYLRPISELIFLMR